MLFGGGYHACEAYDSYDYAVDAGYRHYKKHQRMEWECGSPPDKNFYHMWIDIDQVVHETNKAMLVEYKGIQLWLPKSIIRDRKGLSVLVHEKIFTHNLQTVIEKHKDDELVELADRPKKEPNWWENIPEHGIFVKSKNNGEVIRLKRRIPDPDDWIPLTNEEIEAFKR
jgi:hypothetical protein